MLALIAVVAVVSKISKIAAVAKIVAHGILERWLLWNRSLVNPLYAI